jgi:hypothetical protein
MVKQLIIGLTLIIAFGCTSTTVIPLGEQKPYSKRTTPDKVQVFLEKPDTTFTQIALVDYSGNEYQSKGAAVNALKNKASELGGDAIILQGVSKVITGGQIDPKFGFVTTYDKPVAKAIVIRFIP